MKALTVLAVAIRVAVLVGLTWLFVGFVLPTPDPLAVMVVWLLVVGIVFAVPAARRRVLGWVYAGR